MNRKYVGEYRGFSIYKSSCELDIYNKNGRHVGTEHSLQISAARHKIDKILSRK